MGTRALVLGLGSSGVGAAKLLLKEGADVVALDEESSPALQRQSDLLAALGATVELGATRLPQAPFDLAVISPGIRADADWVAELRARGVPLVPEVELGWSRFDGDTLAVTGTNGKSTTVKFLADVLRAAGRSAVACGNYGVPVTDVVRESPGVDTLVIEASSFQLEMVREFRPDAGVLLNLLPNHLDRHGTMERYAAAKMRLFERMGEGGLACVHWPLAGAARAAHPSREAWTTFGASADAEVRFVDGRIESRGEVWADLAGTYFGNPILGENAAAAVACLRRFGVAREVIERVAGAFEPLPHRMQTVAVLDGVRFINDSKATTLAATAAALRMAGPGVRLIAGGLLKEKDLHSIKNMLVDSVTAVYLIGQASEALEHAWSDAVRCVRSGVLADAVAQAWRDASEGETVLLSPGCASFDQFKNFEDRGSQFTMFVKEIATKSGS